MFSEVLCIVEGKVQGVGFRDFAQKRAKELRLLGWVKNREDDTVAVLAQGYPDDLKRFVEELNEGSVLAQVASVSTEWRSPKEVFDDFSVLF